MAVRRRSVAANQVGGGGVALQGFEQWWAAVGHWFGAAADGELNSAVTRVCFWGFLTMDGEAVFCGCQMRRRRRSGWLLLSAQCKCERIVMLIFGQTWGSPAAAEQASMFAQYRCIRIWVDVIRAVTMAFTFIWHPTSVFSACKPLTRIQETYLHI